MQHSSKTRQRLMRSVVLVLALAFFTAASGCTVPAGTGPGGPTPLEEFCEFFDKVEEEAPTETSAVLVKDDVVALAEDTEVHGQECTEPSARIDLDGAVLAEGMEIPSEEGNPSSDPQAAVTGDEVSAEEPVLDNVTLTTISAEIGPNGIVLRGSVAVRISGVTSQIGFVGTLLDLNNWSISLSSSSLTIPGITSSPATFSGTLSSSYGVTTLTLQAAVTSAQIGDVTINSATLALNASSVTGVDIAVTGDIKVGPSTATGSIHVEFDRTGALVIAEADIDVHLVGIMAGGDTIDMVGKLDLEGNADETVASFSGSGNIGDLQVNMASGSISMTANKATFIGVLDIQQGPVYVRFNGSIVWDGAIAYTPFLTLEAGGEYSGTLENGQNVSVAGALETTIINGQVYTTVTGDFEFGTLSATGSAVVDTFGPTTVLTVDADVQDAGFDAHLSGVVQLTNGVVEDVDLNASVAGQIVLGDAILSSANLHIETEYGEPLEVSFDAAIQVGTIATVTADVEAVFGPNGTLMSLKATGNVNGSLSLGGWGVLGFNGSVVITEDNVSLTGSGAITFLNFPAGISFNGTLSSSLTTPSWDLSGSGRFRIGPIDIASARVEMSSIDGMKAFRAGFYLSFIGIPLYLEANFYLEPAGGCSKVDITNGGPIAKLVAKNQLPGLIGCPVYT